LTVFGRFMRLEWLFGSVSWLSYVLRAVFRVVVAYLVLQLAALSHTLWESFVIRL